jgi:RPE4 domain-containing protein
MLLNIMSIDKVTARSLLTSRGLTAGARVLATSLDPMVKPREVGGVGMSE